VSATVATAQQTDLLRLSTAGSVDDGKSTLIGRLLYETKSIFDDQLQAVERASRDHGDYVNLALLTDGLRAEREQGITKRKFIMADTPGHVQYTRNMVTGTSTADLTIVLLDARKGITEQSRRHVFLASMLHVPHFVICINKMDLVGYSEEVYDRLRADFLPFLSRLEIADVTFIPISALHGDNVVDRSSNMLWYGGAPLLHHLENVYIASDRNLIDVRFPVQCVIRPMSHQHHDYRGYAGQVAGGVMKPGDEVLVLPAGFSTRVKSIETYDGPLEEAFPPMSVTVTLEDDIDISRGDMLCRPHNQPTVGQDLDVLLAWMATECMQPGTKYTLKHTTRTVRALVKDLLYRVNINSLHRDESAAGLNLNEIGRATLRTTAPLFYDPYRQNRTTGSFILIDDSTNATVGAGTILGSSSD
jgi:bifunctional enzyme CysN/CysC